MSSCMTPVPPLHFLSTGLESSVQAFLTSCCAPSPPPTQGPSLPFALKCFQGFDLKCSSEPRPRGMLAMVRRLGHLGLPSWRLRALLITLSPFLLSPQHRQLLGMGLEVTLA